MKMFVDAGDIYLCRDPVDFRKAINGLVVLVEQQMGKRLANPTWQSS